MLVFDKLFAIALLVDDFDRSLKFYRDKLGLEVKSQEGKFAAFELGGTGLAIFGKSEATAMFPAKYMKSGGGVVISFQVDDVAKTCKELKSEGIEIIEGPKTTDWGQVVAYFLDPDGNVWEVSNANFEE
jgi:lactoylglutathione lyase